VEGNDLMSVSQVKRLCEQNQVGLPEYVWSSLEKRKNPEFDQVLDGSYHQQTGDGSVLHSWYDH
jgi:hypothetical protein